MTTAWHRGPLHVVTGHWAVCLCNTTLGPTTPCPPLSLVGLFVHAIAVQCVLCSRHDACLVPGLRFVRECAAAPSG